YYNLGVVYRHKGQDELALSAYQEALRLNHRMPDAHLNLGNLYRDRENYKAAITHYEEALKLRPDWPKALDGLAAIRAITEQGQNKVQTAAAPVAKKKLAPERQVDPDVHGTYLTSLHSVSIEAEESGRGLHQILEREVERAVKMLSTCLLYSNRSRTELDECL